MGNIQIKCGKLKAKGRIYKGTKLHQNGIQEAGFFQDQDLHATYIPVPVMWKGQHAQLYFWNWRQKRTPYNQNASALVTHPGFEIHGPALVITGSERWHLFRVFGDERHARSLIEHVAHGFYEAEHVVFKPSGRHKTHTYIYVRNDNDAVAVRMAI